MRIRRGGHLDPIWHPHGMSRSWRRRQITVHSRARLRKDGKRPLPNLDLRSSTLAPLGSHVQTRGGWLPDGSRPDSVLVRFVSYISLPDCCNPLPPRRLSFVNATDSQNPAWGLSLSCAALSVSVAPSVAFYGRLAHIDDCYPTS